VPAGSRYSDEPRPARDEARNPRVQSTCAYISTEAGGTQLLMMMAVEPVSSSWGCQTWLLQRKAVLLKTSLTVVSGKTPHSGLLPCAQEQATPESQVGEAEGRRGMGGVRPPAG
jgi:hypothetical protein